VAWTLVAVAALLVLAIANISIRSHWREVEDGVFWVTRPVGVIAQEVAPDSPADAVGIEAGDCVVSINGMPVTRAADVLNVLRGGKEGQFLSYTIVPHDSVTTHMERRIKLAHVPQARNNDLYYVLAAVGIFTLIVGTVVRLRRPGNQATLHFFWLSIAFFAVFAFSASGRLDRLDWVFYWAN
jgi:hypothetical protein